MANTGEIISDYLQGYMQERVDLMKQVLLDNGVRQGSALMQSIEPHVTIYPESVIATISVDLAEDGTPYHEFIDRGVKGLKGFYALDSPFSFKNIGVSASFEKSIATWMKAKYGVGKGFDSKRGEFYGMAVNIKRRGIRPTGFITDVLGNRVLGEIEILEELGIKIFDQIQRL